MIARTHGMIAFACLTTAAVYYSPLKIGIPTISLTIVANIFGSMLPDIDQASNRLWDFLPWGDEIGKILSGALLSHRSLSHSIIGFVIFDKATSFLVPLIFNPAIFNAQIIYFSVMVGYIAHLLADSVTEEGLPLLFPLKYKFGFPPIRSWRIKTGHWFEKYIVTSAAALYLLWLCTTYWNRLINL